MAGVWAGGLQDRLSRERDSPAPTSTHSHSPMPPCLPYIPSLHSRIAVQAPFKTLGCQLI